MSIHRTIADRQIEYRLLIQRPGAREPYEFWRGEDPHDAVRRRTDEQARYAKWEPETEVLLQTREVTSWEDR